MLALEEPQRRIVLLHYEGDLTTAEIAAREGIPATTVCTHLRRARAKLRERLDRGPGGRGAWLALLLPAPRAGSITGLPTIGGIMATSKLALTGLALGAAAVGWLFWSDVDEREPVEAARATVSEEELVSPAPIEGDLAAAATPAPLELAAPPRTPEAPAPPPAPGLWLVGEIAGPPDEDPPRARVAIHRALDEEPLASWSSGLEVERELDAELLARCDPTGFFARFDHPDFLPEERWLPLPPDRAADERDELRCDVELRPAAGIVEGVIRGVALAPDSRYGAALFRMGSKGEPLTMPPVDRTPCDELGRYRLKAERPGEHVVVATELRREDRPSRSVGLPWSPSTRPESQRVDFSAEPRRSIDFWIGPGETISGRVVDEEGRPAGEHALHVHRVVDEPSSRTPFPAVGLTWLDGRFENVTVSVLSGADGSFTGTGLGEGEYRITWLALRPPRLEGDGAMSSGPGSSSRSQHGTLFEAPAEDVVLRTKWRTLELRTVSRGEPIGPCSIQIEGTGPFDGGGGGIGPDGGVSRIQFRGDCDIAITISRNGHEPKRIVVREDQLIPDEVLIVELEPTAPLASLALDVALVGLDGPLDVRWNVVPLDPVPDSGGEPPRLDGFEGKPRTRLVGDGLVDLGSFSPGRYHVGWGQIARRGVDLRSFVLRRELALDLPPAGRVVEPVALVLGGRLVVEVPERELDDKALALALLDSQSVPLDWHASTSSAIYTGPGRPTVYPQIGRNEATAPLAPGDYQLVPRLGARELEPIPFTIHPGEVTEVRVDPRR